MKQEDKKEIENNIDKEEEIEEDMAFIDENVNEKKNRLNISVNEKDDLDELDDE